MNLFESGDLRSIQKRLESVAPQDTRQWGKMSVAQMLAHCSAALDTATGTHPRKRAFIGYALGWMVRKQLLGEAPFGRDSPTDPSFKIVDERDFAVEKRRLSATVQRFAELGPEHAARQTHSFLGRLSGEEWGRMMYKHLDHHLRQFGR